MALGKCTIDVTFLVLILLGGFSVEGTGEFQWIVSPVDYSSGGWKLNGHVVATYDNTYLVTQCARRCLTSSTCASYNFIHGLNRCEINNGSHLTFPNDLTPTDNVQYYLPDAFTVDKLALGPCADHPCDNGGTCLTSMPSSGILSFYCHCAEGWTGRSCSDKADVISWSQWNPWSACSSTCGDGFQIRARDCINLSTGAKRSPLSCYQRDQELQHCHLQECPYWSPWTAWSPCTTPTGCGAGSQWRGRTCLNGGTVGTDRLCIGPINQTMPCREMACDAPVRLQEGTSYGEGRVDVYDDVTLKWLPICADGWAKPEADVTCKQLGMRSGASDVNGYPISDAVPSESLMDFSCSGNEAKLASCSLNKWQRSQCTSGQFAGVQCKVDGQWSTWSEWATCSVTCASGINVRNRQCNSPSSARDGKDCAGNSTQFRSCTLPPCPVDGFWSSWSNWSACNVSCGGGFSLRTRNCTLPMYGGTGCNGSSAETIACNTQPCPVDGIWNEWGPWSSCNATCGSGTKLRFRQCTGPYNGGKPCPGPAQNPDFCNDDPCPVDGQWSEWSRWSACTVSCGTGTQERYRKCASSQNGGKMCPGEGLKNQECDQGPCPVDCVWREWGSWTTCNVTCGGGLSWRSRSSIPELYEGAPCNGSADDSITCNTNKCPIPGQWEAWSDWSVCSVTCGPGGLRMRNRTCNMTTYGTLTLPCLPIGGEQDTKTCNDYACFPIARSCREYYVRGLEDNSSFVTIDPDQDTGSNPPFTTLCQRNNSGIITTVHNQYENLTIVQQGTSNQGVVKEFKIQYLDLTGSIISTDQLSTLVDRSNSCIQYISWKCYLAPMNSYLSFNVQRLVYWKDRYLEGMGYWGDMTVVDYVSRATSGIICSCGEKKACGKPDIKCTCDLADAVWRSDAGILNQKSHLPVTTYCVTDTGNTTSKGAFEVGPLICTEEQVK